MHLADPVDPVVLAVHPGDDGLELGVADGPRRRWALLGRVVGARGDRHASLAQRGADRLDPVLVLVLIDVRHDRRDRRSSSPAKEADADRNIAFARRSPLTSRWSLSILSASVVLVPGRPPSSICFCVTHPRRVSALIPSCSPIRAHAPGPEAGFFRASTAMLIARSRSSSGYFPGAALCRPPWLEALHQSRHETVRRLMRQFCQTLLSHGR